MNNASGLQAFSDDELVADYIPGKNRSVFLTCEHASNHLPSWIDSVSNVEKAIVADHWGWDIGALGLSRVIAAQNDYPLVASGLSRLICDLNRPIDAPDLFRNECDGVVLSFNQGLSEQAVKTRHSIHSVFHQFTTETMRNHEPHSLVSVHSFTPVWRGVARDVEVGILFNAYESSAERLMNRLIERGVTARLNEPYSGFADGVYSIERQGRLLSRPYLEIEVRQDLIDSESGQQRWGSLLSEVLASDIFS